MSIVRTLLWIALVASIVFFQIQTRKFEKVRVADIEDFEFASSEDARQILTTWQDTGLLRTAVRTIRFDFAFIVIYLMLLIGCSNDQMTVEKWPLLNHILRLNILLAVVVVLLDLTENIIFLHNVQAIDDHINSYWITLTKFSVAYWVAGVWVFSKLKSVFT